VGEGESVARRPAAGRDAQGLRPLGLPRPVRVRTDADGVPVAVMLEGGHGTSGRAGGRARRPARTLEVEAVLEVWRLAEGWWSEAPIDRSYYRVAVDGGRALTLFRDDADSAAPGGRWYEQRE
jgi:hypothetical protein